MSPLDISSYECRRAVSFANSMDLSFVPAPAVVIDDSFTIVSLNDQALSTFERTGIMESQSRLVMDLESERTILAGFEALKRGKADVQVKIYFHSSLGENVGFDVRMRLHPDSDESRILAIALFVDISHYYKEISNFETMHHTLIAKIEKREEELEARRDQLLKLNAMESTGLLVGGLNHDISNMMAVVKSSVEYLQGMVRDEQVDFKVQGEYLELVEKAAKKTLHMNDMFLKLVRPSRREFKPFDLVDVVRNVAKICSSTMSKKIRIRECYEEGHAYVMGNRYEVEQSVLNLCINASHAMTVMREDGEVERGRLSLSLEPFVPEIDFARRNPCVPDTEYWKLTVADTGVGIPESVLSEIFEPLFTTKGDGVGTGIGLAIVQDIVGRHRGVIEVDSEVGVGTSFNIYIPCMMI